jgi:hypothetical protein
MAGEACQVESARIHDTAMQYMGPTNKFTSMHKLQNSISSRPAGTTGRHIDTARPASAKRAG